MSAILSMGEELISCVRDAMYPVCVEHRCQCFVPAYIWIDLQVAAVLRFCSFYNWDCGSGYFGVWALRQELFHYELYFIRQYYTLTSHGVYIISVLPTKYPTII